MSKKVFVKTFGCQMNVYDSNKIIDVLKIIGYEKSEDLKGADCFILNTCHIRDKAKEKVYHEIGRVRELFINKNKPLVIVAGCLKLTNSLLSEIKSKNIDFVIANGENAASQGVGLTKEICKDFFNCGVNVITTGNHVWDQKEIMEYIDKEERLLRPKNLFEPAPGKGFNIYKTNDNIKIGVLNLMGNVFMKKCEDVFQASEKFLNENKLTEDYDILVVDFHGEITSEKNAIGHFFDGKATLVVGTHTHIPTNDARVLNSGTGYQTDAGMCGDYDSVIGMNKDNSLNRFMKKDSVKHFPADGEATLSGVIVDCDIDTGLASKIESYIFGGQLKNT